MELYVFDKNDVISSHVLDGKSIWEDHICKKLAENYVAGNDMVDIGANLGLNTLGCNKYNPITGTVHLFEPQSDVFTILNYNTRDLNRQLYNFALSDAY